MQFLKANTAVTLKIGPFVDITDAITAEEAESPSVLISKNGAALGAKNEGTTPTHDDAGYYSCALDTTDTNAEGTLVLAVEATATAAPIRHEYMVMAEASYDSLFAAKDSGYMDVNIKAVSEDTTAADNLESACDNYSATRGLSGTALPDAAADAAGGLPISDAGGLDLDTLNSNMTAALADTNELQGDWANGGRLDLILDELTTQGDTNEGKLDTIITDTNELQTDLTDGGRLDLILDELTSQGDTNEGKLDTVITDTNELQTDLTDGGRLDLILDELTSQGDTNEGKLDTIDGVVDDILLDTAEIGAAGAGLTEVGGTGDQLTAVPWNASWDAEVQSECQDAITASSLPTAAQVKTAIEAAGSHLALIKAVTDALTAAAAAKIATSSGTMVTGTAIAGTLSTTQMSTDLTEATNDHYVGRIIIWTTGDLANQASDITAYNGGTKVLTYSTTTEAPTADDTFVIV